MRNGYGIAGFILSLFGLPIAGAFVVSSIFWLFGLIFSIIGMFKRPRGFAIAGLIISLLSFLLFLGALMIFGLLPK